MMKQLESVISKLGEIAQEQVPEKDYQQQVDRWNRYQASLQEINDKVEGVDVSLRRNVKHNYRTFDDGAFAVLFLGVIGITIFTLFTNLVVMPSWEDDIGWNCSRDQGCVTANEVLTNSIMLWGISGTTTALLVYKNLRIIHKPKIIRFNCKPSLHIDDMHYVYTSIKGIERVQRDPVVQLPSITMALPTSWISQQSLLSVMQALEDVNLPADLDSSSEHAPFADDASEETENDEG